MKYKKGDNIRVVKDNSGEFLEMVGKEYEIIGFHSDYGRDNGCILNSFGVWAEENEVELVEKIPLGAKVRILNKTVKGWGGLERWKGYYPDFPYGYYSGTTVTHDDSKLSVHVIRETPQKGSGNFFNRDDFEIVTEERPKLGDGFEAKNSWYFKEGEVVTYFKPAGNDDSGWFENERSKKQYPGGIHDQFKNFTLLTPSNKESEGESGVKKEMAEFQVGDKIRVIGNTNMHCFEIGHIGMVTWVNHSSCVVDGNSSEGNVAFTDMVLLSDAKKTMIGRVTLSASQKKNLSKDAQALVEAGWYDSALNLTNSSHFINFLKEKFEVEYAAAAKSALAEDDAEKAKAKKSV